MAEVDPRFYRAPGTAAATKRGDVALLSFNWSTPTYRWSKDTGLELFAEWLQNTGGFAENQVEQVYLLSANGNAFVGTLTTGRPFILTLQENQKPQLDILDNNQLHPRMISDDGKTVVFYARETFAVWKQGKLAYIDALLHGIPKKIPDEKRKPLNEDTQGGTVMPTRISGNGETVSGNIYDAFSGCGFGGSPLIYSNVWRWTEQTGQENLYGQ